MGKDKKEARKVSKKQQKRLGDGISSLFQNEVFTCNCHCCRKIWYFYIWVLIIVLIIAIQWVIQFSQLQSLQKEEQTQLNAPTSQTLSPDTPQLVNIQKQEGAITTNANSVQEISSQTMSYEDTPSVAPEEPSAPPIPPSVN